jgi:hypothetical protein
VHARALICETARTIFTALVLQVSKSKSLYTQVSFLLAMRNLSLESNWAEAAKFASTAKARTGKRCKMSLHSTLICHSLKDHHTRKINADEHFSWMRSGPAYTAVAFSSKTQARSESSLFIRFHSAIRTDLLPTALNVSSSSL